MFPSAEGGAVRTEPAAGRCGPESSTELKTAPSTDVSPGPTPAEEEESESKYTPTTQSKSTTVQKR